MKLPRRPRRMRQSQQIRNLCQETWLRKADFILPLFVKDDDGSPEEVASMPGVFRYSIRQLVERCDKLANKGLGAVALFPCVNSELKSATGDESFNPDNLVCRTIRALKKELPDLSIFSDVALDPYTTHGHDGILSDGGDTVLNDETVDVLTRMAIALAQAGSDWVAPSDMMDGRVGAIRSALDDGGCTQTSILAYSAKYASAFYGPFRDAVGSSQSAGTRSLDKNTYQMNPANAREALTEVTLDLDEGADAVMVKPAGAYLDVIRQTREISDCPVAAYQVSGEYAMLHAAAQKGWLDLDSVKYESLLAIKRAGADWILSYFTDSVIAELEA